MAGTPRQEMLPKIVIGIYALCFCVSTVLAIVCGVMRTRFGEFCPEQDDTGLGPSTAAFVSASLAIAFILNQLSFTTLMVLAPLMFVTNSWLKPYLHIISGFTEWFSTT
jgi:hypothetical protein